MSSLFKPFNLSGLALPNRIVMAPMTRSRSFSGAADELVALYYSQRATAGLIVTEGTPISREGQGYLFNPGIFSEEQIKGWRLVTQSVHSAGGRIFAQLWHVGRISNRSIQEDGKAPVSSTGRVASGALSFVRNANGEPDFVPVSEPRALTTEEVKRVIGDFVQAARNAVDAGFDGVELHGANGYLLEQFINPLVNDRDDIYSAKNIEGRLRFVLETVDAVSEAIGASRVAIRLSPYGTIHDNPLFPDLEETYVALAAELGKRGVAYVHVMDQSGQVKLPYGERPVSDAIHGLMEQWRPLLPNTALILAGGLDQARAQRLLDAGLIDLAAFGQPFIANPDLVERLRNNWPLAEPDRATYYGGGRAGYVDYPPYAGRSLVA
ncbi:alkene reductase [Brucella sp. NM4]|uniref:alkene reductase n=1 Tax=Brucella/Ochrobactrum group TaxID=2826938 RepID=UPI0024BCAD9A|nr:alkene reductase [Brucella sp. NM4]WHS30563.1 alkene reductase [Brucella sp. NM4]WHT45091.1 alkene reductase [Ochrobactrum sp. SSR]